MKLLKVVDEVSDKLAKAIKENNVDEGFIGSLVGGLAGATIGASIMKAVCKALGVTEGPLYNTLTSRAVCAVAGAAIGASR